MAQEVTVTVNLPGSDPGTEVQLDGIGYVKTGEESTIPEDVVEQYLHSRGPFRSSEYVTFSGPKEYVVPAPPKAEVQHEWVPVSGQTRRVDPMTGQPLDNAELDHMSKTQLEEYAAKHHVELGDAHTKKDILDVLRAPGGEG